MHRTTKLFVALCVTLVPAATFPAAPIAGGAQERPPARRVDQVDTYHGVGVHDPYRWLEQADSPQTHAFVQAQQRLIAATLDTDPRVAAYRDRSLRLQQEPSVYGFSRRGGRVFYNRTTLSSATRLAVRVIENGVHRTLIDSEERWPDSTRQVQSFVPDHTGRYLALIVSHGSGTPATVRVLEVASGRVLDDAIPDLPGTSLAWLPGGEGFVYTAYPIPPGGGFDDIDYRHQRVLFHRLGTAVERDRVVYERPDEPEWSFGVTLTGDRRALVISATEARRAVNRLFLTSAASPGEEITELELPGESTWSYVDNAGDRYVLYTQYDAPRGRIVEITAAGPNAAVDLIPEREDTIGSVLRAGDRYLVTYLIDARREIRLFGLDGRDERKVELPGIGGLATGGYPGDPMAFAQTRHVGDPGTHWSIDVRTGEVERFMRADTIIDVDRYVIEQAFVTSADGTRVPLSLVRRGDLRRDGTNPVFMYGYGAWKWAAFPYFQVQWHMWIELGGIFVVPNVRGGGEYGEAWHQGGIKLDKQHAVDDTIAAAEWMVESGWSSAGRIVANGGSASGLLAAAATMQRPDLFGGAVIDHPSLDLLRAQAQPGGHFLVPEYGSVDDPAEFHALRAISPYHNLHEGTCYPPMLVTVGEADRTIVPMHGLKFIAGLQHAQSCDNPALLQWVPEGGHLVFGTTREEQAQILARQLAFALAATDGSWARAPARTEGRATRRAASASDPAGRRAGRASSKRRAPRVRAAGRPTRR